ncbi:MAG TPA: hypothetical protein VHF22_06805 [Planctomycetota bacterium]|nr:hypothetical protein [Planctomycetota bacterium]
MIEADEALLARIERTPKDTRGRDAEVEEALGHISKQFQLWDVKREVLKGERPELEPVQAGERAIDAAGPRFEVVLFEATRAMAQVVAASAQAKKAFTAFRALKRVALRKPYKPAG